MGLGSATIALTVMVVNKQNCICYLFLKKANMGVSRVLSTFKEGKSNPYSIGFYPRFSYLTSCLWYSVKVFALTFGMVTVKFLC